MKKSGKFKLSLLGSIGVSLLAVSTAAVSTFAWFRAEADVQVSAASSDPVSITVNAPDPIQNNVVVKLYAYKDNGTTGYRGTLSNKTFATDFPTQITNFNTALSGLTPNRSMSFCLHVHGDVAFSSLSMSIDKINDSATNNTHKRWILNDGDPITKSSNFLKMSSAITFTGDCNSTGTYTEPTSAGDIVALDPNLIDLKNTSLSSQDAYFFYTLKFVDDKTTRYVEYIEDNGNYSIAYTSTSSSTIDDEDRYFLQNDNGSNSCFEGLNFTINEITVNV